MFWRNKKHETLVVIFISLCVLLAGCVSRGGTVPVDDTILDYQRQITNLEGRITSIVSGLDDSVAELVTLSERSRDVTGGIDEVIELFDRYQQAVDELISVYRELTESVEGTD